MSARANIAIKCPSVSMALQWPAQMRIRINGKLGQNDSYEITVSGYQVRKTNEIRNVIFGLRYRKPASALRPKLGC